MTITLRPAAGRTNRAPVDATRKTAFIAGVLFLITYLTAIPPKFALYPPLLDHADYILGTGSGIRPLWGAFLEILLIIANIGTAIALFSILKRQHEGLALAYVAARVVESTFILIGVLSVFSIVTLRQDFAGAADADAASYLVVGKALVAIYDWTFLLGPGFVVGVGNGLILGYLMYRSGLVPRGMAMLGLVGGPLICLSGIAVMFDLIEPDSALQIIAVVPEFFWELSLGIYLMVKGFKPSAITAEMNADTAAPADRRVSV